jgi:carboxylesterase
MAEFIPGCEPFCFEGGPTGILLVHGFTGTPREMRWMGEYLAGQGLTVLGVRLAGHATTPEDMEPTTWRDWWGSVKEGYAELDRRCERVFVMGLSLGGMLTLHIGAHYPEVAGLVAMSAPGKPMSTTDLWVPETLGEAARFLPPDKDDDFQDRWVAEEWHISYDRQPLRCIASLFEFSRHLHDDLPDVRVPLLLIHSRLDGMVLPDNMPYVHGLVASTDKEMMWVERSGHVVTEDLEKDAVFARAYAFVQAHG